MGASVAGKPKNNPLNVLLIGNNPRELSTLYNMIKNIKKAEFITDFAFDLKHIFLKIVKSRPHFILIDDAISKKQVKKFARKLSRNKETEDIPIAVLKSSNYKETLNEGVSDFILKENLSSESLYHAIVNSIKSHRTYRYLNISYRKRAGQLARFFKRQKTGL